MSSAAFGFSSAPGIPAPQISQRFSVSQTPEGGKFFLTEGGISALTQAISDGTQEWMESLLRRLADLERVTTLLLEEKKQTDAILAGLGDQPSFAAPETKRSTPLFTHVPSIVLPRVEQQQQQQQSIPGAFGSSGGIFQHPFSQPVSVPSARPTGRQLPVFIQLEIQVDQKLPTSHMFSKEQLNIWIDKLLPEGAKPLRGLGKSRREVLFLYPDSVEWWSKPLSEQRRLSEQNSRIGTTGALRPTAGQYGAGGAQVSHLALGIPTWVESPQATLTRGPMAFAAPGAGIYLPERSGLQQEAVVLTEMDKAFRVIEQELKSPKLTDRYQAIVALHTAKTHEPLFGKYGLQPLPANSRTQLKLVQWLNSLQPSGYVSKSGPYTWDPFAVA